MRLSIPGSASAELPPVHAPPLALPRGFTLAAIGATAAARLGFALVALVAGAAVLAPVLATSDPFAITGAPLDPPSRAHPMGTDALGRDLYSGVLYGARASLLIATAASALAFALGVAIGLLSGYARASVDAVLMRITELFQVIPRFLLVVVAAALFGAGAPVLVLLLGLTSWPALARVIRAEVVSLRALDFVRAAEASGASAARIIWRELLPNVLPAAVTMLGLLVGQMLLVEAGLGFLGVGDPNTLSWGMLAARSQGFLRVAWWLALFPGLAITLAVLGINLIADGWARATSGR